LRQGLAMYSNMAWNSLLPRLACDPVSASPVPSWMIVLIGKEAGEMNQAKRQTHF
jgi:hypothetical protein